MSYYELQCSLKHESIIEFGDEGDMTVEDYINHLLKRYDGIVIRSNSSDTYPRGVNMTFQFPTLLSAQCFFAEFKRKITPRMFSFSPDTGSYFDDFKDDKLNQAIRSSYAEMCYHKTPNE